MTLSMCLRRNTPDDPVFYAINDEDQNRIAANEEDDDDDHDVMERLDMMETEEESRLLEDMGLTKVGGLSLKDHYEKKSKNNELLSYVFGSVAKGKDHVLLADVLDWDFSRALINQGTADDRKIIELFSRCNPRNGQLNVQSFERLVDLMGQLETTTKPMKKIASSSNNVIQNIEDEEDDVETFDDNDFDEALDNIFEGKKVRDSFDHHNLTNFQSLKFSELMNSDLMQNLLEDDLTSEEELREMFVAAGASIRNRKDLVLSENNFETFMSSFRDFFDGMLNEIDEDPGSETDALKSNDEAMNMASHQSENIVLEPEVVDPSMLPSSKAESLDDDAEVLEDVFRSLAGSKDKVSVKDMLNWDLCDDLIVQGLLTEEHLAQLMEDCGGDKKGVDLDGFDRLVDKLVSLYDNLPDVGDEIALEDFSSLDLDESMEGAFGDDELADDEEIIDIDIEEDFVAASKGKEYMSLEVLVYDISKFGSI